MKNLTVGLRLSLGFAIVVLLLIVVAALGISRLAQLNEATRLIADERWHLAQGANDMAHHTSQIAISLRNMMLTDKREDLVGQKSRIADSRKTIDDRLEKLAPLVVQAKDKEMLSQIRQQRDSYFAGQEKLSALIESGQADPARLYLNNELRPVLKNFQAALAAFTALQGESVAQASLSANDTYERARTVIFTAVALSVVLACVLSIWIIRSVINPLGGEPSEAKAVLERIAQGDLTGRIFVKQGDSSSLLAATELMQGNLRRMLNDLKTNAESVAAAAHQLAAGSAQVAAATEEQSAAAASMASSIEEMTVSINHVADSAREAHSVTVQTGNLSQNGKQVIEGMSTEMRCISETVGQAAQTIEAMGESSEKISGIVQVIREVAEQTNLLALNAAIEAARAGEQGRGFAVVADEVRKLAERTAAATTEIASMIDSVQGNAQSAVSTMQQAVARVTHGVDMAQQANESVSGITDGAHRVVTAVTDISHAITEQGTASNQIAANVERIAHMSEENSTTSREAATTARQLESLAAHAQQAIRTFRL